MIAAPHPLVGAQPVPGADRDGVRHRRPASTPSRASPLDAIPDLSDTQVIVYTEYPGQAPQVVEDQVTYPLTTAMLSVPQVAGGARLLLLRRVVRLRRSSRTAPTSTGRARACSNISTRRRGGCRPA